MSETQTMRLSSLKDICRCCHSGGNFYSLKEPYKYRGKVEVYYRMLIETFGILICPPTIEVSYTICDDCINRLRDSTIFRSQIEACEEKFNQYSQLFFKPVIQNDDCVDTMDEIKKEQNSFENINNTVNKDDNVELKIENVTLTSIEDGLGNDDEAQDVEDNELDNIEYELRNIDVTEDMDDEENFKIKLEDKDGDVNSAENALDKTKLRLNCTNSNKYVPKSEYNSQLKKHVEESECINNETFDSKERKKKLKHPETKYTCDICGQQFLRKDGIRSHMSIHMGVKENSKCNSFLGTGAMKAYSHTKDKNSVQNDILSNYLECRFCKKKVREHYYERHLKVHVKKTECINCGEIFDSTDLLKEHFKKHKLENMYTCDFCKKGFIVKSTLKRHIDLHHMGKGRKFMCHECGIFCNDITNLRAHTTAVHLKLRMFECSVCQKKLASKKTLKIHMRTHTGERPYVCDECDEGFVCFTNLKIHKKKHDIMKKFGTKYVCEICHTTFRGQRLLTHHVRSEHPGCLPITSNKYKRKYLPCPTCNKVFSQKYSLHRHMTKHGDIVKIPCELCNKMLIDKSSLNRHIRNMHTSKEEAIMKKVQCGLCKRKVKDIESHMAVHTVRPMTCEICGKNYPDAAVLRRHVRNVHHDVNKIFQCTECDRRPYSRRESLRSHMLKKHGCDLKSE